MSRKLRPLGEITDDQEKLMREFFEDHGMQFHEVLGILYLYTLTHFPSAIETYEEDGSHPILKYGPRED